MFATMCWRQVSKFHKSAIIFFIYFTIYVLVSLAITPETKYKFISNELRIGDKYALIFLSRPRSPVFSDVEGAEVFTSRKCGKCFITNNLGFLPMSEYDAILVHGDKKMLSKGDKGMYPEKKYLIETSAYCLRSKFKTCRWEPKITSFTSKIRFDFCSFCDHLLKQRIKSNE